MPRYPYQGPRKVVPACPLSALVMTTPSSRMLQASPRACLNKSWLYEKPDPNLPWSVLHPFLAHVYFSPYDEKQICFNLVTWWCGLFWTILHGLMITLVFIVTLTFRPTTFTIIRSSFISATDCLSRSDRTTLGQAGLVCPRLTQMTKD